jgi:uracil-DNA glycosylase
MDSPSQELANLITETKKQLEHLRALGVDGIQLQDALPLQPKMPRVEPNAVFASRTQTVMVKGIQSRTQTTISSPASNLLFCELGVATQSLSPSDESFEQIHADIGNCTRCPLHQERTHVVHTEGNRKARLMFVGEAPGADEDAQARPFVGRAGQLLTKIIEAIGLKREEVLIGNVNRCRPPGNRPPTSEEAAMCKPFLLREIAIVQPEVIVVLGNTAMRNLLDTRDGITKLRGRFQDYKGIKVMPTYHPAYLLRDPSKKRETWEDLKKVREYLDNWAKI